jgi:hypothetical protein
MKTIKTFLLAATVGGIAGLAPARADLVQNGSFENPTVVGIYDQSVPTSWDVLGASGNNAPVVGSSSIDHVGPYWQAADLSQSLDLNGLDYGVIGQTLATTPGQKYMVKFALSGNPDGGPWPKYVQVDVISNPPTTATGRPFRPLVIGTEGSAVALDGVAVNSWDYENVFSFSPTNPSAFSYGNMEWQMCSFTFTATSTTEYLQFTSRTVDPSGNGSYPHAFGPALDAVSVVPVPLPAAAGVGFSMLGGFGGLFAFRKRLKRQARIA